MRITLDDLTGPAAVCSKRRQGPGRCTRHHDATEALGAQPVTATRRAPAVASQPGWVGWTSSATSRPGVPTGTSHAFELSAPTCGSRPWTRPPQAALTVSTKWYCVVP